MTVRKEFTKVDLEHCARIDFLFDVEKGRVTHFVINLALVLEDGTSHGVYRVDTCHGFLHEQRFWQSGEKIMLQGDYTTAFASKKAEVMASYPRWIRLFRKKRRI